MSSFDSVTGFLNFLPTMIAAVPITSNCPRCSALVGGSPDPATGNLLCQACGSQFDPRQAATAAGSAAPVAAWQPATGDELTGGYILECELGRGGMATVWQARQASLSRRVAIKILHAHLSSDVDFRRRFLREAEAMVQLDHPHIVPVLNRGEYRNRPFLVSALAGPKTLRDEINKGRLTPIRVANITQQVLTGLAHAHSRGLIHRDIKPENLLISDDGKVHITDFGIAQVALSLDGHTLTQLTGTNVIMGTVAYMAPEQSENKANIDHRCDLYSLGVVCYEALIGHRPIGRFEDPGTLLNLSGEQCAAWDRFILGLLERDPDKRIADAHAALQLLPSSANNGGYAALKGDVKSQQTNGNLKSDSPHIDKTLLDQTSIKQEPALIQYIINNPLRMGMASIPIIVLLNVFIEKMISPFVRIPRTPNLNPDILVAVLIALPFITLLLQAFPYFVLRKMGVNSTPKIILLMAAIYAVISLLLAGPAIAIIALGGSLTLALLWYSYRQISFFHAFIGLTLILAFTAFIELLIGEMH